MALIHYLLVYDLNLQKLIDLREFADGEEAAQAYARMEAEHRGNSDVEIVLVGADSIETIQLTHGQYFDDADTESPTASPYLLSS